MMTLEQLIQARDAKTRERNEAQATFYRLDGVVQLLTALIAQEEAAKPATVSPFPAAVPDTQTG